MDGSSSVHQTGTAAELTVKLLLTETVGLDHLTEHLISIITGCIHNTSPADQTITLFAFGASCSGATAAQTVFLTPVTHLIWDSCCLSRVVARCTGLHTLPLLLQVALSTLDTLLLSWPCTSPTRRMAWAACHFFQMEKGSIGAFRNTSHPRQTVAFSAGSASVCIPQASHTGVMTLQTLPLILISKVAWGTGIDAAGVECVDVKASSTGETIAD